VIVEMEAAAHDKLMASVQVLRHLLIFCFGGALMRIGFEPASELPLCGPWFGKLVEMLGRQLDQNPGLYAEIAFPNQATEEVVDALRASVEQLGRLYTSKDKSALVDALNEISSYLKPTEPA
jgi:prephenate dehydrogenase